MRQQKNAHFFVYKKINYIRFYAFYECHRWCRSSPPPLLTSPLWRLWRSQENEEEEEIIKMKFHKKIKVQKFRKNVWNRKNVCEELHFVLVRKCAASEKKGRTVCKSNKQTKKWKHEQKWERREKNKRINKKIKLHNTEHKQINKPNERANNTSRWWYVQCVYYDNNNTKYTHVVHEWTMTTTTTATNDDGLTTRTR